jgi:hypothetical protein
LDWIGSGRASRRRCRSRMFPSASFNGWCSRFRSHRSFCVANVACPFKLIHTATSAASSGIAHRIRGTAVKWHSGLEIRDPRAGIECDRCERVTVREARFTNHFKRSWKTIDCNPLSENASFSTRGNRELASVAIATSYLQWQFLALKGRGRAPIAIPTPYRSRHCQSNAVRHGT